MAASRSASSTTSQTARCACAPARHGPSMERKARHLLALHLAAGPAATGTPEPPRRAIELAASGPRSGFRRAGAGPKSKELSGKRTPLVIGGGIAAYNRST